jgi:hypothetical protein
LFSSITITTWSGGDADTAEDAGAAVGVATGGVAAEAVPGSAGGEPGEHATAATMQAVRNAAATTRRITGPLPRLAHPFALTLEALG